MLLSKGLIILVIYLFIIYERGGWRSVFNTLEKISDIFMIYKWNEPTSSPWNGLFEAAKIPIIRKTNGPKLKKILSNFLLINVSKPSVRITDSEYN